MSVRTTPIGQVVLPVATWNPQTSGSSADFLYIDIGSLDREAKTVTNASRVHPTAAPSRARQIVHRGDILVSTVRPNLNAVALVPDGMDGATASTGFTVLRPSPEKLYGPYLFHWVRTPSFVADMVKQATGASYPAVSDRIVLQSELPLPPLPEQRRIADILDKADAVRRKRKEAIALTEELLRSAFLEMFGDPVTNPKGWPIKALGELVRVTDGTHKTPVYVDNGVPFLSAKNVRANIIDWAGIRFITPVEHADLIRRCRPQVGDVLITKSGTIGEAACVDRDIEFSLFESVALLQFDRAIVASEFLASLLNNARVRQQYGANIKGIAVKHLHLVDIRRLPVIVPSRHHQEVYARVVQRVTKLRERLVAAHCEQERLYGCLMHRAFRGELARGGAAAKAQLALFTGAKTEG